MNAPLNFRLDADVRVRFWAANLGFWAAVLALGYVGALLVGRPLTPIWRGLAIDGGGALITLTLHAILLRAPFTSGLSRAIAGCGLAGVAALVYASWGWLLTFGLSPDPGLAASTATVEPDGAFPTAAFETIVRWTLWSLWPFLTWTAGYLAIFAPPLAAPRLVDARAAAAYEALQRQIKAVSGADTTAPSRWFWIFNPSYWLSVAVLSLLSDMAQGGRMSVGGLAVVEFVGFLCAAGMHVVLERLRDQPMRLRAGLALAMTVPAVLIYASALWYVEADAMLATAMVRGYEPSLGVGAPAWAHADLYFMVMQRLVFLNLWFFIAWVGLYLAIDYARRAQRERENLLRAARMTHDAQLRMLRFQLNPHFLFNTLNAISTLVLERDAETAESMIGRLSRFLRMTLDAEPTRTVSLADEIAMQRLYLEIEQVRFGDKLEVEVDVDPAVEGARIPGLILQPLVENAVKHGRIDMTGVLKVRLSARRLGPDLEICVHNSGPASLFATDAPAPAPVSPIAARRADDGANVGLANVEERLAVFYGERGVLTAHPLAAGGFEARVQIPWRTEDDLDASHTG